MKAYEIERLVDGFAPFDLAYDWDNSGFLCGDPEKEVRKIMVTLDTDVNVARQAAQAGCDMILSHHPIFFKGIKNISLASADGALVKELVKNDIALIAAHTNMDRARFGINHVLAMKLGIKNAEILEPCAHRPQCGLGRYGELEEKLTLGEFAERICLALDTPAVRVCGDTDAVIKTAAAASGSCSEMIIPAKNAGCDVIVTGDIKYHEALDAVNSGIFIIDAGHYPTEIFVTEIFERILSETGLEIIKPKHGDVFKWTPAY